MNKPQLFLIHFAGGNCYSYQFLLPYLKDFIVEQIELPGRGKRINEDLLKNRDEAVEDIYNQVICRIKRENFIIYGHSMGAILGYLVSIKLQSNSLLPKGLIVSGNAGPKITMPNKRYILAEDLFIVELKRLGGIRNEIFEYPELLDFFLPIIRSDFEIVEKNSECIDYVKLKLPIYALMGSAEENQEHINNWKNCTNEFYSEILEGDHFFIHKYPVRLMEVIKKVSYETIQENKYKIYS